MVKRIQIQEARHTSIGVNPGGVGVTIPSDLGTGFVSGLGVSMKYYDI